MFSTLFSHKNAVVSCGWSINGNWLATGSRDQLVKVFDIRAMKELEVYRGHQKEVINIIINLIINNTKTDNNNGIVTISIKF